MEEKDRAKTIIHPDMTVLDVILACPETEAVFKSYDEQAGECICCAALFDSVRDMTERYGLNTDELMVRLKSAAGADPEKS